MAVRVLRRVVVFGGSGFVGSTTLKVLSERPDDLELVSVSRRGSRPAHLADAAWADAVQWRAGDALEPSSYSALLNADTGVVVASGSPPLPTFSEQGKQLQLAACGTTCERVIEAAAAQGVQRVALVSALMPQWAPAGYREGKLVAEAAAKAFADARGADADADAVVLRPAAVYGTRHTEGGAGIPLWLAMKPASLVLQGLDRLGALGALHRALPYLTEGAVEPPVSVDVVAACLADAVSSDAFKGRGLVVLSNQALLDGYSRPSA